MQTRLQATLAGLGAITLWGALAALTTTAGEIPAFQLAAMTFAVGTLVGFAWTFARGQSLRVLADVPPGAWALGVYGLLAFHVCYFLALRQAPALEASLIVYLWPLLIVLMSGALPARLGGARLGLRHVGGALLGLAGAVLILLGGTGGSAISGGHWQGYALALAAAFIWSSYSVASRLYAQVPSSAVVGSCLATALGALALHLMLEETTWPASPRGWLAVLGLGLGPVGLAFYLWDEGMKRGDITLLGVAAYATPLLSSLLLVALGLGQAHTGIWIAAVLITAGALIAGRSRDRTS
ncbi:MAG: DMT family transporter [Proteobacteria bacterium]|nr:DMT family transporter [Pseudomonadota bacterium]